MGEFVRVASLEEVVPGKCKVVEVSGKRVALFNQKGIVYAIEDSCTHLGAPLSDGFQGKGSISCHWHGATFDLKTGEALSAPAQEAAAVYEVRLTSDGHIEIAV